MGNKHVKFMLLICFYWTVVFVIWAVIYLSRNKSLTLSEKEANLGLILFNTLQSDIKLTKSNSSRFQSVEIRLRDQIVLIDDMDFNVRYEKFYKILKIRDKQKLEDLKGHDKLSIAVLVLVCDRVTVRRCLDRLILYRPSYQLFPIIVSQDCPHNETENAVREYGDQVYFIRQPEEKIYVPVDERELGGYYYIANHYKQALHMIFNKLDFEYAIIIEDDIEISPDIYEYFLGTLPILKKDPTLWCVSAWNDHGKKDLVDHNLAHKLYRTDFFPGLGWMVSKGIWLELADKWPASYWDDWMRLPEQRKDRACIRPEISRSKSFGIRGVSNQKFFDQHLKDIFLNEKYVEFTHLNLSYLLKENYDEQFLKDVYKCQVISNISNVNDTSSGSEAVRILYDDEISFKRIAKRFNLLNDVKSGVPRTSYKGIVTFYLNKRIYLMPSYYFYGYNTTWI